MISNFMHSLIKALYQ